MAKKRWAIDLYVATAGVFEAETWKEAIELAKDDLMGRKAEIDVTYCYEVDENGKAVREDE